MSTKSSVYKETPKRLPKLLVYQIQTKKSPMSVKCSARDSRAGNGILWGTWDFLGLSARESLHAHKIPRVRGGGYFGFFGGGAGGGAYFIFMGAGILLIDKLLV